jgi:adenylate cyclase
MGVEIERKFLVAHDGWKKNIVKSLTIAQGYLSTDPSRTVRVRIAGDDSLITIKGAPVAGSIATPEFEYPIPPDDAKTLLPLCLPGSITKTRHYVTFGAHQWMIDVFSGDNDGLIVAEIELTDEAEDFSRPDWLGAEVTQDARYKNSALAQRPFKGWKS